MPLPPAIEQYLESRHLDARPHLHTTAHTAHELADAEGLADSAVARVDFFHCDGQMVMAVLPASRDLDLPLVRTLTGCRHIRLASHREIARKIGEIPPEAIPPFGSLFGLPVFLDESLLENDLVVVPAGDFTHSLILRMEDFLREETPVVLELSRRPIKVSRRRTQATQRGAITVPGIT